MRNWLLMMLIAFFSAVLQAGENNLEGNLFTCVDKHTLTVNGDCVESMVSHDLNVQDAGIDFTALSGDLGENALATMRYYPEKQLIEVIAHPEDNNSGLSAKVIKSH